MSNKAGGEGTSLGGGLFDPWLPKLPRPSIALLVEWSYGSDIQASLLYKVASTSQIARKTLISCDEGPRKRHKKSYSRRQLLTSIQKTIEIIRIDIYILFLKKKKVKK